MRLESIDKFLSTEFHFYSNVGGLLIIGILLFLLLCAVYLIGLYRGYRIGKNEPLDTPICGITLKKPSELDSLYVDFEEVGEYPKPK